MSTNYAKTPELVLGFISAFITLCTVVIGIIQVRNNLRNRPLNSVDESPSLRDERSKSTPRRKSLYQQEHVLSELDFLARIPLYDVEKPYQVVMSVDEGEARLDNIEWDRQLVPVNSIRGETKLSLARNGFAYVKHESGCLPDDNTDLDGLRAYMQEGEALLTRMFGAIFVHCYSYKGYKNSPLVREADDGQGQLAADQAILGAHDLTAAAAASLLENILTKEQQQLYSGPGYRLRLINTWRPLLPVVEDRPLAFCDYTSIDKNDIVAIDRVSLTDVKGVDCLQYNTQQRWYWLPEQKSSEPLVFVLYDSQHDDGSAMYCPRVSFDNPYGRPNAPICQSAETMYLVITQNDTPEEKSSSGATQCIKDINADLLGRHDIEETAVETSSKGQLQSTRRSPAAGSVASHHHGEPAPGDHGRAWRRAVWHGLSEVFAFWLHFNFPQFFRRHLRRIARPGVPSGHVRLTWTCHCGKELSGDFSNEDPTAVARLAQKLRARTRGSGDGSQGAANHAASSASQASPVSLSPPSARQNATFSGASSSSVQSNHSSPPAPSVSASQIQPPTPCHLSSSSSAQGNASASTIIKGNPAPHGSPGPLQAQYVEICVNTGQHYQKLAEIDVAWYMTDPQLFKEIRTKYGEIRGWRTKWQYFLRPQSMAYVQFAMDRKQKVHIFRRRDAYPPQTDIDAGHYRYNNPPPPIPSDAFIHYLRECDLAKYTGKQDCEVLEIIAKKLNTRVSDTPSLSNKAYGMLIREGPDFTAILWTMIVMTVIITGPLIAYIICTRDVQSASGLAAWAFAILTLLLVGMQVDKAMNSFD